MSQDQKIVITHWVHQEVIDLLGPYGQVEANPARETRPAAEVRALAADASALMVFMPDSIDAAFMAACPRLKIVAAALKGYDNFDVTAVSAAGAWFTIVPDLLTIPTAELAVGLLIGLSRNLLPGDRKVRSGSFAGWRPSLYGGGLTGKTLGIIGMGRVGRALAHRLAGFEMRVIYCDPQGLEPGEEEEMAVSRRDFGEVVAASDYLVPLVPLIPETMHLIGRQTLAAMKPGAYLINVCRGSVVDEEAVADHLESGHLAGYAADVFEMEDWARPDRPHGVGPRLLADDQRTLLTPHLGSAVDSVRKEIAMEAARNIIDCLEGRVPRGAVNQPSAGR